MTNREDDFEWQRPPRGQSRTAAKDPLEVEQTTYSATSSATMEEPEEMTSLESDSRPAPPVPISEHHIQPHLAIRHEPDDWGTVIGIHSSVDGTLRSESNLFVRGAVRGKIICTKALVIEESGRVNAKIKAVDAVVAGKLDGSITCDGRLEILSTAQVSGELTATVLTIQEGAFFEGRLKMKDGKSGGRPAPEHTGLGRFLSRLSVLMAGLAL